MELFPVGDLAAPFRIDVRTCPSCGFAPLARVADCDSVQWLCRSCERCWREVRGHAHGVDPLSCPGCATKPQRDCITRMAGDFRASAADRRSHGRGM
jgi:hypothetical protein